MRADNLQMANISQRTEKRTFLSFYKVVVAFRICRICICLCRICQKRSERRQFLQLGGILVGAGCAEAVFARGLGAASPVFAAAEVVFVQITGKMGPLYHFVSRVVRCASFYIPSPIAGNHPFTEAAASSSVTTVWK